MKKEDQSVGASVLLRKGNKILIEQIWRQSVEQRLKERPFRDCKVVLSSGDTSAHPPIPASENITEQRGERL